MSRHINLYGNFRELEKYGIECLTGESCAYGMRMLCDLNADGVKLMTDFFGGNITFREGSNWNSTVNGKPSVASILLTRGIIRDLDRFILFHVEKVRFVVEFEVSDIQVGIDRPEELDPFQNRPQVNIYSNLAYSSQPNSGGRNVHAFSNRTV